jgi:nitrogen regulatory protein P-II 2
MVTLKKVTIIAEAVLEARLIKELRALGARGYTITDVRGEGSRGVRASDLEGRNVQIDVLVGPEVSDRILTHISQHYFRHYAVVAYVTEVEVVRGDKYV